MSQDTIRPTTGSCSLHGEPLQQYRRRMGTGGDALLAIVLVPIALILPFAAAALIVIGDPAPDIRQPDAQEECRAAGGVPLLRQFPNGDSRYDGCLAGQPGVTYQDAVKP